MRALGDAGPLVILAVLSVFGGFVDMESLRTFSGSGIPTGANVIAQETSDAGKSTSIC